MDFHFESLPEFFRLGFFFVRCFHTFFHDFELSKRDTGKAQRALSFIRGP